MQTRFGPFELDDERLQLTCEGRPVGLRPKVFDLLAMLVRERHRVVRREELFERLWSTTAVGPGSLSGLVNELRSALGENGRGPSSIRTVHARGYQFAARAEADAVAQASCATSAAVAAPEISRAQLADCLRAALAEVRRAGARALVASIPGKLERSAWLACVAAEALASGFRPRWAVIPHEGGALAEYASASEVGTRECPIGGDGAPIALGERDPIALCLEIDDPGGWGRAGGLRRFLDLLGRAPVLVVAALANRPDESSVRELVADDARIEWVQERADGSAAAIGAVAMPASPGAPTELALALRALARVDQSAFEAALRSMGFESMPVEPVRVLRRAEPAPAWSGTRRDAEVG